MQFIHVVALSSLLATSAWAASPFAGTWKQDRAKSEFDAGMDILTIDATDKGIRYSTAAGPIYGGPLDDSERAGLGAMANDTFKLKKLGDRGYEATQLRNGKVVNRERVEVSDDGKTLTRAMTFYNRKDGRPTTNVFTHRRSAGEPKPYRYIGTWTMDRSLTKWGSEPTSLTIVESGDVLTWADAATNTRTTIDLKTGAVTRTGDNLASDVKMTAKKIDDRTLELGFTRGPITVASVYRVSEDGTTMNVRSTTIGTDGKGRTATFVYDRQQ